MSTAGGILVAAGKLWEVRGPLENGPMQPSMPAAGTARGTAVVEHHRHTLQGVLPARRAQCAVRAASAMPSSVRAFHPLASNTCRCEVRCGALPSLELREFSDIKKNFVDYSNDLPFGWTMQSMGRFAWRP